ncbi:aspartyl protease family protein [Rhizobiales bacterium GAS113]|nr:aspartyl protease family protein [Rhizobiales bacterium GAS113]
MDPQQHDQYRAGPWGGPPEPPRRGRFRLRLMVLLGIAALGLFALFQAYPPALWQEGSGPYFAQYGLIGTVMLMSLAASRRSFATIFGQLALWALAALVIVAVYGYRYELREVALRVAGELVPTHGQEAADGAMIFTRAPDRQFHIDAQVDGKLVRFLLDTGASDIVLNREDAARLGFAVKDLAFTRSYGTANGTTRGAPIRLKQIRIGTIHLEDVPASVNEGELHQSLLGMRFLERLTSIEIRNDRLTIRP